MTKATHLLSTCKNRFQHSKVHLDGGRVEHDTDGAADSLSGEVLDELSTDETRVTVGADDLTPDRTNRGTLVVLNLVEVDDALTVVVLAVSWK